MQVDSFLGRLKRTVMGKFQKQMRFLSTCRANSHECSLMIAITSYISGHNHRAGLSF